MCARCGVQECVQEYVQDVESPRGDNTVYYAENPSGDIMHEVDIVTEDNTVQGVENPSGDNTVKDVEYPNRGKNMEGVTDNPCGHTSSQNIFRDNNCGGETSYPDNQMKSQLMIAQDRLENTNEEVGTQLTNRGTCRQRVTPSSSSNEKPQVRRIPFSEKLNRLTTMVRAERYSNVENAVQIQDYISLIQDILYDLYQIYSAVSDAVSLTLSNYRQLRRRDRAFIDHVQINSSREAERRIQRMHVHVNQLMLH